MRNVSLIMAYYNNPSMLERHYKALAALPEEIRRHLEYIVVDDGSQISPAIPPAEGFGLGFQLYRMLKDIRWNQDACRNIGAHHANHDWLLLTDIDHMVPALTLRNIMYERRLDPDVVYKFQRVSEPKLDAYKPHPNSWLIHRDIYVRAGGYDERFAGWYGTDGDFRDRIRDYAKGILMLQDVIVRVPREVTPDASTPREFGRKSDKDSAAIGRIKQARANSGKWRPVTLSFPYVKVDP